MNIKTLLIGTAAVAALGAAAYGLYSFGMQRGMGMSVGAAPPASATASAPPAESAPISSAQGEAATRRHIKIGRAHV